MNSCLASNEDDELKVKHQGLTSHQLALDWDDSFLHISVCHHPTNWMMFSNHVNQMLNARFPIQLFGHEHQRRVLNTCTTVKIFAGALQPEQKGTNGSQVTIF